ncbi:MAG: TonB-dependent receptor [Hyphomonadaceae bacterium]
MRARGLKDAGISMVWRRLGRFALCATTALTAALAAAPAFAQDSEDEIVVTAQRRAERTLDIGLNVSTLSAQALTDNRVAQVVDLAGLIGNIDIKEQVPGAMPVVTIRGVGLDDFSATNSASAGIYVDEVYLASTAMMSTELYDLARVEVLKGPQGTLYGRNSTAGALNIITQAPRDFFEASLRAGYGNYETAELEGMINVPVNEALALRFSARTVQQGEGYWTSRLLPGETIGERDVISARAQALWSPSNTLEVLLKVEGTRSRSEMGQPEFFGAIDPTTAIPAGPPFALCAPYLAGGTDNTPCSDVFGYTDTDNDPFTGDWTTDAPYDIDAWDFTARITADLNFATLTSISGYRYHDRAFFIDTDATPFPQTDFLQTDTIEQYSQELRLTGESERVDWVLGAFASHDEVDVFTPGFHDFLFVTQTLTEAHQETNSAALFGHAEWRLTDRLSLITGLRYTWEERSFEGGTFDLNPFGMSLLCMCAAPTPVTFLDDEISDRNWSWRVGLEYQPNENTLLYANVSRGVKSGGFFSGITTSNDQLLPYEPEELTAYEIGLKLRIPEGNLRVETSVFYYDYSDFQTFTRFDSVPLPVQRLANIGEAEVWGLDLDIIWSPVENLDLIARMGFLDSQLGAFETTAGPIAAGNRLPNAPELTFTGGARWGFDLDPIGLNGAIQVDANYTSDAFKDALNNPRIASDSHWIWNARFSLTPPDENWEFAVWGRNLGDEQYVSQGLDVGALGYGNRNYNAPMTFGATLTYRWN